MTNFAKFNSSTDKNSDLRLREIGAYHAANIKKIASGGINAAKEYAAIMGGITPHHFSNFPKRLLEVCQNAGDMPTYKIIDGKVYALCLTWEFKSKKSSTQMPVIRYM